MNNNPGTVSRILWHFTGGPGWNAKRNRQYKNPKPFPKAYDNLISIVNDKELKIGGYKEVVRVVLPSMKKYDKKRKESVVEKNVSVEMTSNPVCCLADVPIIHLSYLSGRYGKFAIGFHRDSIVRHGFNPVFYTLENTDIIRSIYKGFSELNNIDTSSVEFDVESASSCINEICNENDIDEDIYEIYLDNIMDEIRDMDNIIDDAQNSFKSFLSFVKTFDKDEFGTIYCEREWRSTKSFKFGPKDIAMIVMPKGDSKNSYFEDFVKNKINEIDVAREIPIIPWEDLIEH